MKNAFNDAKKEEKRKRYKNLWLTDGFLEIPDGYDFSSFTLSKDYLSSEQVKNEANAIKNTYEGEYFNDLKNKALLLLENTKAVGVEQSNYGNFLSKIVGEENAQKLVLDEKPLDSLAQILNNVSEAEVKNFDSLSQLLSFLSSALGYYAKEISGLSEGPSSKIQDSVYAVILGEYSNISDAGEFLGEYLDLGLNARILTPVKGKHLVVVSRFEERPQAETHKNELASVFDFITPTVVDLSTYKESQTDVLTTDNFPFITDLYEKEIVQEETGEALFLGFYKDPVEAVALKEMLTNFENMETVLVTTEEKDYFSVKIKEISTTGRMEDVVDMVDNNFKEMEYSIGNNYMEEISDIEVDSLIEEKKVDSSDIEEPLEDIIWYEHPRITFGGVLFPLSSTLYDNIYFSDYLHFGETTEGAGNEGILLLNQSGISPTEYTYGAHLGISFRLNHKTEFGAFSAVTYGQNTHIIYAFGGGFQLSLFELGSFQFSFLPRMSYIYGRDILLGKLLPVQGYTSTVIINQSLDIEEGESVFSKMDIINFDFHLQLEYPINDVFSVYCNGGLSVSTKSTTTFLVKELSSKSSISGEDRTIITNPILKDLLKPKIDHRSTGFSASLGIKISLPKKDSENQEKKNKQEKDDDL